MNNDKKMDVVDWREIPRPILSKSRTPRRFLSPTIIGVIGTVLIHALILPTAYFGIYGTKVPPRVIQDPGALANSNANAAEGLVLITLPTIANSTPQTIQDISSLPALSKFERDSRINPDPPAMLNMEVLTLGEERTSQSAVNRGDGTEQARLFGIYIGQIQARINRIWRRPRSPVSEGDSLEATTADESFQCQTQIVQDAIGSVQEVLLLRCNGSLAWQRSLVIAIEQASPLPAPPSPSVFNHSITLNFVGLSYVAGSPDDDYEIAPAKLAQTSEGLPPANLPQSNRLLGVPETLGSRN
jgi:TonB-like protein